jgi:hypothetical protein
MATRKYKSKKHLSKKHGKKSKNHKKHAKKTRKYRKKRGGDEVNTKYDKVNKKYLPQYKEILDTLDEIGDGNKSVDTVVPGQFSDKDTTMKPTKMLKGYLNMNNTVSCGRRFVFGDKQNCDKQKRILYNNIITKIHDTRDKIEKNSSLNDEEVNTILDEAEKHFVSKYLSHA